jgi:hypothetical protein
MMGGKIDSVSEILNMVKENEDFSYMMLRHIAW